MKKVVSIIISITMILMLFVGCGNDSTSSNTKNTTEPNGETTSEVQSGTERSKISIMMEASESTETYKIWSTLFEGFVSEKYPGIELEYELLPNDADYANKLQLYIASNQLPDFYGCANGTFSKAAKEIDAIINVGDELKRIGKYDEMNGAIIDFLTDSDDGELYLFPNALYCEFFFYRTDIFEENNLTAPTTWDEFINACDVLKQAGEIPCIIAGSEQWQIMRYLSFAPWRNEHDNFIMGYIDGSQTFTDNKAAQVGVNLVAQMGEKGYWQPGFTSTNYTDATNMFFSGQGAMFYSGSGHISSAIEMYEEGKLGMFPVPGVDGMDNISTNIPIHAGFANTFNKQTYDDVMMEAFEYIVDNFHEVAYESGVFSPLKADPPEGLNQLFYDIEPLFEKAEHSWVSWDDKLDSATVVQMQDAQEELALGMITPDQFISDMDAAIKSNNP